MSHDPVRYTLKVATAAELSAIPTRVENGDVGFIASFGALFLFDAVSTAAADGVTVLNGPGGVGRWQRQPASNPEWCARTDWYVDPVAGNDENPGTALLPLKTWAEWKRRVSLAPFPIVTTVYIVGNMTSERVTVEHLPALSAVTVKPTPASITVLGTGTITAYQPYDAAAGGAVLGTGNASQLTDVGLAGQWTALGYMQKMVRITTPGPRFGAYAATLQDLGGKTVRTTPFFIVNTIVVPQVGDTFEVVSLPSIISPGAQLDASADLQTQNFAISLDYDYGFDEQLDVGVMLIVSCLFPPNPATGGGALNFNTGLLIVKGCGIYSDPVNPTEIDVGSRAQGNFYGSGLVGSNSFIFAYDFSNTFIYGGTLFCESASYQASSATKANLWMGGVGFFDCTTARPINAVGPVSSVNQFQPSGNGYWFGSGNTAPIVALGADATATYVDATMLKVGMAAGSPLLFGATAKNWADLPFVNTAGNYSKFLAT